MHIPESHHPPKDCQLCPRLSGFRCDNRQEYIGYFNNPVSSFGALDAKLLVVGLAPGLHGANRTGRPFTGDFAGDVLYGALKKVGLAKGNYDPEKVAGSDANHSADGFALINTRITNAVRCVPQENKPETSEIKNCNGFLKAEINAMPNLKVILSLGLISHQAVLASCGFKKSFYPFEHNKISAINLNGRSVNFLASYHTSRYNINTGRLTQEMFDDVVRNAAALITR
jgi:uracil-DNA glycosylase family 4